MHRNPNRSIEKVLDALATRGGTFLVVAALAAVCTGAAAYTRSVVNDLVESHELFADREIRNGYIAMSDIQRVLLTAQTAAQAEVVGESEETEFLEAVDMLFVRKDHLAGLLDEDASFEDGRRVIDALDVIIAIADGAAADGFSDARAVVADLLAAAEAARSALVRYLDTIRRQGDDVLVSQSVAVQSQQRVVFVSLLGLTLVGIGAIMLLRREVLARQARARAERRVEFLAFFDPLTELPNRVQHQDRLQALLDAKGGQVALFYIDLDDFKAINDTYGHGAGDAVLCRTADILCAIAARARGFASRLAGDEFALVVEQEDRGRLTALADEILAQTALPVEHEGDRIDFGVSIGIATAGQVRSATDLTVDRLSRVTDFALYASKSEGRRRYTVYDEGLEARFVERREMLDELPRALASGDIDVYLQPKVLLDDERAFGFEALVRWHRNGRIVPPGDFIEIAEESGNVVDVDNFVLNRAAALVSDWNARHNTAYSVSVNLSTLHFNSHRIVEWVEHALWRSDIPPHLLTLEITETREMRDWNQAQGILKALQDLGCRISIDDFGVGFSSLSYLRSTRADELKIDRSLVEEIETSNSARHLLASVFDIARNLDLEVIVEGIETRAQAGIVRAMGARHAQGFLFGRPAPAVEALGAAGTELQGGAVEHAMVQNGHDAAATPLARRRVSRASGV